MTIEITNALTRAEVAELQARAHIVCAALAEVGHDVEFIRLPHRIRFKRAGNIPVDTMAKAMQVAGISPGLVAKVRERRKV